MSAAHATASSVVFVVVVPAKVAEDLFGALNIISHGLTPTSGSQKKGVLEGPAMDERRETNVCFVNPS